ncbi:MAG TPA: NAD(P)-dependent oxidoreductase [Trebonia sp.]|jgi:phosphoglycerate dehydrogenase-like enzyme|nr:NAD(P)-dependent oxidoreductase [Trebonia sp.]
MKARVGIACNAATRARFIAGDSVARLARAADVRWLEFDGPDRAAGPPPADAATRARLIEFAADLDALVVSHGCPRVDDAVLAAAPSLRLVGDLHGDRFAARIDVAAAARRGVWAVDTTNASSDPVAEWALALMLIGLRNAGALFRRLVAGEVLWPDRAAFTRDPGYLNGELTGKTVGIIACGHIGRRLLELLAPFGVTALVYDPHAPEVLAEIYDLTLTSLDRVMTGADVVVCLAPLTSQTRGLIGPGEIEALRPGSVFVNVSRGPVVDSAALTARLGRGDVIACLDVWDPEPVPADAVIRSLPNVFLSPHIAGVTAAAEPRFFDRMVDEVLRALAGDHPRHQLVPREPAGA